MATTSFKADLPCARCGQTNAAWLRSDLDDRGAVYKVGDYCGDRITILDFDASCLTVRRPDPHEPIRAVMNWTCTNCRAASFGEVVFSTGVVTSIEPVELDAATLDRVHYITDDTEEMLEAIAGEPLRTGPALNPSWLALVRAGLAAGRRW